METSEMETQWSFLQEQFYMSTSLKFGEKLRTRLSLKPCLKISFWDMTCIALKPSSTTCITKH